MKMRQLLPAALLVPLMTFGIATRAAAEPAVDLRGSQWYGSTFPSSVTAMVTESNRLHVALGPAGVTVIDISNPWVPVRKGTIDTDGNARDIAVSQGIAYVADDTNGLVLVDVRNAEHPVIRSRFPTTGSAWAVVVRNSTAFVADSVQGLVAVDVHDPDHPTQLQRFATPQPIVDLALTGDLVVAATGLDGIRAFRFPASGAPSEAWHLPDPTPFPSASNRGVTAVAGGPNWVVYSVAHSNDIRILDLTTGEPPGVSSHFAVSSSVKSMAAAGDDVLIADSLYTTIRFRITGRHVPFSQDRLLGGPESVVALAQSGDFIFQFDSSGLLYTSDLSNPALAVKTAPVMGRLGASQVLATDTLAFVGRWEAGIQIFDLMSSAAAEPISRIPFFGNVNDQAVENGFLYVVNGTDRLRIFDVHNPAAPVELPSVQVSQLIPDPDTFVPMMRIEVVNGRAYISTWSKGLFILDVSDPTSVKTLAQVFNKTNIKDIVVRGTTALVVYSNEATFVDLSTPGAPVHLSSFSLNGAGGYSIIEGTRAYITDGIYGLYILDITNPRAPKVLAARPMFYAPGDIATRDGIVSMITYRGLEVLDARNPAKLTPLGIYAAHRPEGFTAVAMNDHGIYATDPSWGMFAIQTLPGLYSVLEVRDARTNGISTLEWSPNIGPSAAWSPLVSRTNPPTTFHFLDYNATNSTRFYRVSERSAP